jgi:AcrR family transcriptional regulator
MVETTKFDGRRQNGQRTRRRLIRATRGLVAERGRAGVTLRAIADAADANVAAVSYHFGSTDALLEATIEEALETLTQAQIDGLEALPADAALAEIATAWAGPAIEALSGPPTEARNLIRIAAQTATDPSDEFREQVLAAGTRAEPALLAALRRALPGLSEDELRFRTECATGILHFMATGVMRFDLEHKSAAEVTALLIPSITGALAGGPVRPA